MKLVEAPSPRQGIRTVPGVQLASLSCVRRRKMEDAGRLTGRTALMGGEYLGCSGDQGFSPIVYVMPWRGRRAVPMGEGREEGGRDPGRANLTRCMARVELINHGIKRGNAGGSGKRGGGGGPKPADRPPTLPELQTGSDQHRGRWRPGARGSAAGSAGPGGRTGACENATGAGGVAHSWIVCRTLRSPSYLPYPTSG